MGPHDSVNILLVDDQPAKLLSYEVILSELGHNLLKAGSAREALEQLLRNEIAVVLVDVSMPDLDGFELAQMIRDHPRFRNTAIIFVSAVHLTDLDRLRGYELGAVDYVPVPVVPEVLRAKVRVFAELYRKTRELELLNRDLEHGVAERTAELAKANADLERRVEERTQEREAALAQIYEMQKMESLGQLTGGVAHDFNNLLTVVLGSLSILRKRLSDDPKAMRLIDSAFQAAERGAALIKRMLAFARRQELKPEIVEIPRLVEGMTEMLRRTLGPMVRIDTDFPAGLPAIRVDPNLLELALLNLALNARDAMPNGGRLKIEAHAERVSAGGPHGLGEGRYVRVAVSDTGSGMDEATLKRASEPFFTTKGAGAGSGLGLSMVQGFALQSGGTMHIASGLGEGTIVDIRLPVGEGECQQKPALLVVPESVARPIRILVVDDDALTLAATAAMLEDLGHEVVEATSGARALELLHSGLSLDLVITDQGMPEMAGTDLVRQIREEWPGLPVVLATGYADVPLGDDLQLLRLSKPFLPGDLTVLVERVLHETSIGDLAPLAQHDAA